MGESVITDFLINIVYTLFSGFVNLLPAMPEKPSWYTNFYDILKGLNYYFPMVEAVSILAFFFVFVAGIYVWRAIRLFFPGG